MVDTFLLGTLFRILDLKPLCIYFVGDKQQLPPVGAGSPFHTFIEKNMVPVFELTHIFRQKKESSILPLAFAIAHQEKFIFKNTPDIEWIASDKNRIVFELNKLIDKYYDTTKGILNFVGVTFLNRGAAGTIKLNAYISEYIHLHHGCGISKKIGDKFYVGDIIIVTKNIYKENLRNGQMGRIMDANDDSISIYFQGMGIIRLSVEYLSILDLGYVINVYKSQGSEFRSLVIFLFLEQYILLNRHALYTAVTRTKNNIIFLGEKKAFYCAIHKEYIVRSQFLSIINVSIS